MPDFVLGVDVAGWAQYPGVIDWPAWYIRGVRFAFIQQLRGRTPTPYFAQHRAEARLAGVWDMQYQVLTPWDDPRQQAIDFVNAWPRGWRGPAALDVEISGLEPRMLETYCDTWDFIAGPRGQERPLIIYTRTEYWERVFGKNARRYQKYILWLADYGTDRITSVPTSPILWYPDIWIGRYPRFWQFAGDNGRLDPYEHPIDLNYFLGDWFQLAQLYFACGDSTDGEPSVDDAQLQAADHFTDEVEAAAKAMLETVARVRVLLHPAPPPPPPPPPVNWWETWPDGVYPVKRALPLPAHPIPMRDENGDPWVGVSLKSNSMEARERRGDLFRVLDTPISGRMWWARAEDFPTPA